MGTFASIFYSRSVAIVPCDLKFWGNLDLLLRHVDAANLASIFSRKIYLKGNPEAELAVWSDALVVRQLPVMVQQLTTNDLWLAVDQELVDGLENTVSFGFAENDRKQLTWSESFLGARLAFGRSWVRISPDIVQDRSGIKALPGWVYTTPWSDS